MELYSDTTERFFSAKVHQVIGGRTEVTSATGFMIPKNGAIGNIQEFLKNSFMERMGTMIAACATKKVKEQVRDSVRNAKFTDITLHVQNFRTYTVDEDVNVQLLSV
jgi:hypothetical protein